MLEPSNANTTTDSLDLYIQNSEWTLTDFAFKRYLKVYDCCAAPFPDITYFLVLRRSPSYYIFRFALIQLDERIIFWISNRICLFSSLVIPSAFITVITIVGFFTPHSTTGENTEKVSLGVSTQYCL
jgi:nicotinic acetylcholine receptor